MGALEQLRHLSRWTRRLLVVTGPRGIGKTTLYRALSANLDPRARAARINGTLVTSDRDVMISIAQGFGIGIPSNASGQLLFELVASGVMEAAAGERVCMVLIDDAQLLDARAVDQLLNVVAQQDLRVVCFAEREFIGALQRSAKRLTDEVPWHELSLPQFNPEQTRDYLEWRCDQAGYGGGTPFNDDQVNHIASASGGLPAKVNALASDALMQLGMSPRRSRITIPFAHRTIAVGLVVLLAAFYLVWPPAEDDLDQRSLSEFDMAHGADLASSADVDDIAEPAREREAVRDESSTADAERSELAQATIDATSTAAIAPPSGGGSVVPATPDEVAEPASQPASSDEAIVEQAVVEPASVEIEEPAVVVAAPAQRSDERAERPDPASPVRVEERSEPAAVSPRPGAWRDGDWLLAQSDERYTIQLLGSGDAERVREYLGEQSDPREFASYRTRSGDRELYIVVYGLFTDRDAALAAASDLPPETGRVGPWVRKLSAVKSAVRAGR